MVHTDVVKETGNVDDVFETLCHLLDEELERQENVLALCRAQGQAARVHDTEYLEARTAALQPLIQDAARAEQARNKLVYEIAERSGVHRPRPTLTDLIPLAPEPWASRMRHYQVRLHETVQATRVVVRANATVLRSSLRIVTQAMNALQLCCAHAALGYAANGSHPEENVSQPTMIDRQG